MSEHGVLPTHTRLMMVAETLDGIAGSDDIKPGSDVWCALDQEAQVLRDMAVEIEETRSTGEDVTRLRAAIQMHLDTFGYDNHEGLADALVEAEPLPDA